MHLHLFLPAPMMHEVFQMSYNHLTTSTQETQNYLIQKGKNQLGCLVVEWSSSHFDRLQSDKQRPGKKHETPRRHRPAFFSSSIDRSEDLYWPNWSPNKIRG